MPFSLFFFKDALRSVRKNNHHLRLYYELLLPSMKCIRALFLVCLPFCDVAVGVGESDGRDLSAPAQAAPRQAGFGSGSASACWLSVLLVTVLGGDMVYSSWVVKGIRHPTHISASCGWFWVATHQILPRPTITSRVGMTARDRSTAAWSSSY